MTAFQPSAGLPAGFAGVVRLFPLPNLVLFPHVVQALHVFEPRYRELVEDALAGDQLIALALLEPGWEPQYHGRPPIGPVVGVGKVMAHSRLEDGRWNILLHGVARGLVLKEYPPDRAFRLAEIALIEDVYPAGSGHRRVQMQTELLHMFRQLVPDATVMQEHLEQLASHQLPLGVVVDVVAFTLPLDLSAKQQLLAEPNVDVRAARLLTLLRELAETSAAAPGLRPFPPDFSTN